MFMTEDQKKYYNAMKKLSGKGPAKATPRPKVSHNPSLTFHLLPITGLLCRSLLSVFSSLFPLIPFPNFLYCLPTSLLSLPISPSPSLPLHLSISPSPSLPLHPSSTLHHLRCLLIPFSFLNPLISRYIPSTVFSLSLLTPCPLHNLPT